MGISQVIAGLATLAQYPLYILAKTYLNSRFAMIDAIQGFSISLGTIFVIAVAIKERKKV